MAYEVADDYAGQEGEGRVVKHLLYSALVDVPNPSNPDQTVRVEKVYRQGETVPPEELNDYNLERGERLGSFYTDEELENEAHLAPPGPPAAAPPGEQPSFDEMGESELADYIMQNKPNVGDTVAMAQNNPDTAQRLLEAEHIATDGEPRAGVVKGLNAIIEGE